MRQWLTNLVGTRRGFGKLLRVHSISSYAAYGVVIATTILVGAPVGMGELAAWAFYALLAPFLVPVLLALSFNAPSRPHLEPHIAVYTLWASYVIGMLVLYVLPSDELIARKRASMGLCIKCGYDLRATPDRCPECGTECNRRDTEAAEK